MTQVTKHMGNMAGIYNSKPRAFHSNTQQTLPTQRPITQNFLSPNPLHFPTSKNLSIQHPVPLHPYPSEPQKPRRLRRRKPPANQNQQTAHLRTAHQNKQTAQRRAYIQQFRRKSAPPPPPTPAPKIRDVGTCKSVTCSPKYPWHRNRHLSGPSFWRPVHSFLADPATAAGNPAHVSQETSVRPSNGGVVAFHQSVAI